MPSSTMVNCGLSPRCLYEQRLSAIEDWAAAELILGRHRELAAELAALPEPGPVRERLIELHMLALHLAGRTADALSLYESARARLAEGYGLEPGRSLRRNACGDSARRGGPLVAAGTVAPADAARPASQARREFRRAR
jgi:DNA-binding SARP family transcriptional activator